MVARTLRLFCQAQAYARLDRVANYTELTHRDNHFFKINLVNLFEAVLPAGYHLYLAVTPEESAHYRGEKVAVNRLIRVYFRNK